jgi:hypothetical protein
MWVVALLAPHVRGGDTEPCVFSGITALPRPVLAYVQRQFPTFQLKYSKTVQGKYYANNCPDCGVIYGDFYLHDEPGAPFFPTTDEEANSIVIETVPLTGAIALKGSCGYGVGGMILRSARPRRRPKR